MATQKRLNIQDVEKFTGVNRMTIWRWYKAGKLPAPHYINQKRYWYETELLQWENEAVSNVAPPNNLTPATRQPS